MSAFSPAEKQESPVLSSAKPDKEGPRDRGSSRPAAGACADFDAQFDALTEDNSLASSLPWPPPRWASISPPGAGLVTTDRRRQADIGFALLRSARLVRRCRCRHSAGQQAAPVSGPSITDSGKLSMHLP